MGMMIIHWRSDSEFSNDLMTFYYARPMLFSICVYVRYAMICQNVGQYLSDGSTLCRARKPV